MGRKHDVTDIYGVKRLKSNPLDSGPDAAETGFRHSTHYHRYFRGYTEIRRIKPNGKIGIERYYTQPWIVSTASGTVYWAMRMVYVNLVILCAALYIWALTMDLPSNRSPLVAVPGMPAVIALFLLAVVTVIYFFAPRRMTLWDHESSTKRLKLASLVTAGFMAAIALMKAVFLVLNGNEAPAELGSIVTVLLAGASASALFFLERKVEYSTEPNNTVLPEGEAHEIW